ncbi:MAG TPA: alanine--glyoxylate aminotransferase family protein [Candidatus Baltobacteraceae bacterium]
MQRQLLFIPGPVTVPEPILAALARPMVDHRGPEYAAILERISQRLKPVFGTSSDVMLLGSSGTGALEAAVTNSFSPGQRLLSCPVGVFGKRLANIAKTNGMDVEMLETPLGERLDAARLAERLRADTKHEIAGILLTHNETSTGVQNDMALLSAAIGDHPATVVVDSVSGLGATEFKMDAWGFDVVAAASQKVFSVPPGMAMVAVSKRGWERFAQAQAPRFYFDLRKAREFAEQGQTPWTPPVSIAYGMDVAIDLYELEGAPHVWARHARYAEAIRAAVVAMGLDLFSAPDAHSVTVVAFKLPAGADAGAVRRTLREQYGIIIGGGQQELKGKILRIGTMGDIGAADVLDALSALEATLRGFSIDVAAGVGPRAAREVFAKNQPFVAAV